MTRPWLVTDAVGAGKYAVAVIRRKPKQQRTDDADLAAWCARWAWHWAQLALGDES